MLLFFISPIPLFSAHFQHTGIPFMSTQNPVVPQFEIGTLSDGRYS